MNNSLFERYNVAVPRYTSYPAVPDWQKDIPSQNLWLSHLNTKMDTNPEVSLYIHLPFCEKLCTYCACNKRITKNHGVESPYINTVLAEWQIYLSAFDKTPVIKELHLGGGTPTFFSPESLNQMLTGILSTSLVTDRSSFSFEAHPNSTTDEHLSILFDLGFRRISVGVQDVDPFILQAINRIQTVEEVQHITQKAREIGYTSVNYDIIYGLPFQRLDHIEKTIEFVKKERPDRLAFYSYAHVPWKSKGQRAFTAFDSLTGLPKQQLRDLGHELLIDAGYHGIGMDHYSLDSDTLYQSQRRGKLHRNFMGFTDQKTDTLIGLGNSAISDSNEMYVQNEKTVEAYSESIHNGVLPIIKGHQLSLSEQRVKEHILDLICNHKTRFRYDLLDLSIQDEARSRLQDLMLDGILMIDNQDITITEKGLPFIRNVCASLDPKLSKGIHEKRFSKAI